MSLELLRKGQSDDGGWGPRTSSPPEPYDTAALPFWHWPIATPPSRFVA